MVLFCGKIDSGEILCRRPPGFIISEENMCQTKADRRKMCSSAKLGVYEDGNYDS